MELVEVRDIVRVQCIEQEKRRNKREERRKIDR